MKPHLCSHLFFPILSPWWRWERDGEVKNSARFWGKPVERPPTRTLPQDVQAGVPALLWPAQSTGNPRCNGVVHQLPGPPPGRRAAPGPTRPQASPIVPSQAPVEQQRHRAACHAATRRPADCRSRARKASTSSTLLQRFNRQLHLPPQCGTRPGRSRPESRSGGSEVNTRTQPARNRVACCRACALFCCCACRQACARLVGLLLPTGDRRAPSPARRSAVRRRTAPTHGTGADRGMGLIAARPLTKSSGRPSRRCHRGTLCGLSRRMQVGPRLHGLHHGAADGYSPGPPTATSPGSQREMPRGFRRSCLSVMSRWVKANVTRFRLRWSRYCVPVAPWPLDGTAIDDQKTPGSRAAMERSERLSMPGEQRS